jgi:hypothetical protein
MRATVLPGRSGIYVLRSNGLRREKDENEPCEMEVTRTVACSSLRAENNFESDRPTLGWQLSDIAMRLGQ